MAQELFFTRDTKFYVAFDNKLWDIPILADYSFSQATSRSEITLDENEAPDGTSRRGTRTFNDALEPAEWSVQTYLRPFNSTGNIHKDVSEVLWALLMGANAYSSSDNAFWYKATSTSTFSESGTGANHVNVPDANLIAGTFAGVSYTGSRSSVFNFLRSNRGSLGTADLFFVERPTGSGDPVIYKIVDAVVNEASLDFPTDGIASVTWSGFGTRVDDVFGDTLEKTPSGNAITLAANDVIPSVGDVVWDSAVTGGGGIHLITTVTVTTDSGTSGVFDTGDNVTVATTSPITSGTTSTSNLIRNRVSQLGIDGSAAGNPASIEDSYSITLTGATITINNNITFLTPEEIGKVNVPLGHITGARTISGDFTCYVVSDDSADTSSSSLFNDIVEASTGTGDSSGSSPATILDFHLRMFVGGGNKEPRVEFDMPNCNLSIPTHAIDEMISVTTEFTALGSSISDSDEMTVRFIGE